MKAIIVDDERHVREGLLLLANWSRFKIDTILQAENGDEARQIITAEKPDIIFTDMRMPKTNGVELLKWLNQSHLNAKTIVISGYDDFEYMKNAIKFGSFDYLLKPIDPSELNEVLARAVDEVLQQKKAKELEQEKEKVVSEIHPIYCDKWLTKLVTIADWTQSERDFFQREFQLHLDSQPLTVAIFSMTMLKSFIFEGNGELAVTELLSIAKPIMEQEQAGFVFSHLENDEELVFISHSSRRLESALTQVKRALWSRYQIKPHFVIGPAHAHPKESYLKASTKLASYNLINQETESLTAHHNRKWLLLDYKDELKWTIECGHKQQLDLLLHSIFESIEKNHTITFRFLKNWENHFDILRSHWLQKEELPSQRQLYWTQDGRFSFHHFKQEKREDFFQLFDLVATLGEQEQTNMSKVASYIESHYHYEISLQEISEHFYLSREYISRKFKQEFNQTITDYLMNFRIKKAKELLANPNLKVYEVAEAVGYQHDKYFAKVFKRIVGLTPSDYRQTYYQKRS
ncbi:hypothetical protein AJ85_06715 [Alkalihalobacillus alcalophilus ATCC 27647 = CGMCC 1.3604]|uniref:AraC family transcriptional regulator n=1 Tax=Alkalihalobacillus alcalophilus ATCC 27647 = CGMCC 1.3604 TaxID=1218173 RepID=A0A094WIE8_ALKAL|nr:response regulator [Alkalihalobacillus alcalophilus]KGA97564.1 hypothetical protein BALCAV_0209410 [Alkalihalobacillus alcalophilus ATCC 27647 = CGMCC 1.3604]MED1562972.1 response regulator [Alkalihalobacillus alcalophilus]THG91132.1 hypothetical protein AJ85_06715 [Alkalihalobacillus alcalophilus ATCC 27647 = CGMCC 1.3604]